MSTTFVTRSSWISSLSYFTAPDGTRYLAVFTTSHTAFLFANVPAWLPGLIASGVWKRDDDGRNGHYSPGRAFHRYVRSQPSTLYPRKYLSTRHEINALSDMINACEGTARERSNTAKRARRAMSSRENRIRHEQEMRAEAENAMAWS